MMAAMISPTIPETHDKDHGQPLCVPRLRSEFMSQFGEAEFHVADVLLNLPYLITNSLSNFHFSTRWGTKRKRSAEKSHAIPPPPKVVSSTPPPKRVVSDQKAAEVTSPDTPLDFCPSDSEGKSKQRSTLTKKRTAPKKKSEEQNKMILEKLQTQQTVLKEEMERLNLRLKNLQDENSELKSKKQKLIQQRSTEDVRKEKIQLEGSEGQQSNNPPVQLQQTVVNDYLHQGPSTSSLLQHHLPSIPHLIINPTAQRQLHYPQLGPLGFDLNISAEEMVAVERTVPFHLQPLDHHHHHHHEGARRIVMSSRAYADHARARRQYRILQNRQKKTQRGRSRFVHASPTC